MGESFCKAGIINGHKKSSATIFNSNETYVGVTEVFLMTISISPAMVPVSSSKMIIPVIILLAPAMLFVILRVPVVMPFKIIIFRIRRKCNDLLIATTKIVKYFLYGCVLLTLIKNTMPCVITVSVLTNYYTFQFEGNRTTIKPTC